MRSDGLLVTTPGLTDTIVVATKDVVLVADKAHDQQVKDVAQRLRVTARSEASAHPVVFRPWGGYEAVDARPGCQVKHISVKPGRRLSL